MAQPIYGIEEFCGDDRHWRLAWFAGVTLNPRVPSEPVIEVLLQSLPGDLGSGNLTSAAGPLARQVRIGVGQLPYISIGSVWHRGRRVSAEIDTAQHVVIEVDTARVRYVSVAELGSVIPKSHYAFGRNWPYAARTQVAALEVDGDPYAVLVPVVELIRFYYASSTRLAQALFWGEYANSINPEKCGQLIAGPYRVHLRKWISDSDAWTLARFHASHEMQNQVRGLYKGIQKHRSDSLSAQPEPFRAMRCGFPFSGRTTLEAVHVPLPGESQHRKRTLILRLLRCSGAFPFGQLLCDRDNRNLKGKASGEGELIPAWRRHIESDDKSLDEWGNLTGPMLRSDGEPNASSEPLVVDIREDRFSALDGMKLLKDQAERQKYRSVPMVGENLRPIEGFGTGSGIWAATKRIRAEINTKRPGRADIPSLPASLDTFFVAMDAVSKDTSLGFKVRYVERVEEPLGLSKTRAAVGFPTVDPITGKGIRWAIAKVGDHSRPRGVVIAEVRTSAGVCYVLEAERLKDAESRSILVIAEARGCQAIAAAELQSLLLGCATKGGWLSADKMPAFRRVTTSHQQMSSIDAVANRIARKICEVTGMAFPPARSGVMSRKRSRAVDELEAGRVATQRDIGD